MSANELVRRMVESINGGQRVFDADVETLVAPDYELHDALMQARGPAGVRAAMAPFFRAFPDLHAHVEDIIEQGDRLVYRGVLAGTHTGDPLMGIEPSGRHFEASFVSVNRVANGLFAEEWQVFDFASMMQQLNPPTGDAHRALLGRWVEAMEEGNLDAFDDLAHPDYLYHGPGFTMHGLSEFKALLRDMNAAFPDLKVTVHRTVSEGNLLASHFTLSGRQERDFIGIPCRGAMLHLPFLVISRVQDGKVAEDWEIYDTAEMRRQLEAGAEVVTV